MSCRSERSEESTCAPTASRHAGGFFAALGMTNGLSLALLAFAALWFSTPLRSAEAPAGKIAPKPLFRDPVVDGAADPSIVYDRAEQKWLMFYTNRRANVPGL